MSVTPPPDLTTELAQTWDRRYLGGVYEAAPPLPEVKAFVDTHLSGLGAADRVLDLGCGNGRHLRALAGSTLVVGTDVSREGLRVLALTLDLEHRPLRLVRCRHAALPFRPRSFAAALVVEALEGPPDEGGQALRSLHRALWRDAVAFVRVAAGGGGKDAAAVTPPYLYKADELQAMAEAAGFDVVEGPVAVDAPCLPPLVGRAPFLDVVLRACPALSPA